MSFKSDRAVTANGTAALLERLALKRREIVRPLLDNPTKFVLHSLRGASKELGIDPATLLRIVRAMGFEHYHEFQQYLHNRSLVFSTSFDAMQQSREQASGIEGLLLSSLDRDLENLKQLRHNLEIPRVVALAKKLYTARRILIVAGDMAANLARFLDYNLGMLGLNTVAALSAGEITHRVHHINKQDLVIAITYGRGLRQTVEGLKSARERGAHCVVITDTFLSPAVRFADQFFLTSTERVSFAHSYVAGMAFMNALLVAAANVHRSQTVSYLKEAAEEQRGGYRWYTEK